MLYGWAMMAPTYTYAYAGGIGRGRHAGDYSVTLHTAL